MLLFSDSIIMSHDDHKRKEERRDHREVKGRAKEEMRDPNERSARKDESSQRDGQRRDDREGRKDKIESSRKGEANDGEPINDHKRSEGRKERRDHGEGKSRVKEDPNERSVRKDQSSRRDGQRRDDREGRKDKRESSRKGEEKDGEPIKTRLTYTSDNEANSKGGFSPEKQSLTDRLMTISAHSGEKESSGKWLKEQMEEYKRTHGVDSDEEPTEEEIKMQIKLPAKKKVEKNEFKEPLKIWEPVEHSTLPSWRKELLPEEEVKRPSDWRHPTPPRVDISLQLYKQEFREEIPKLPKIGDLVKDKETILRENFAEHDEFVLFNNYCVIRTTKAGIQKSKRDRQDEERGGSDGFGGGGWGGRGGGGRGGLMGGGGRSGFGGGGRDRDRFGSVRYNRFQRQRSVSSYSGRESRSDSFDRSGRRPSSYAVSDLGHC